MNIKVAETWRGHELQLYFTEGEPFANERVVMHGATMTHGFNADPSSAAWLRSGERIALTREERAAVTDVIRAANEKNAFKICYYGKPVGQPVSVKKTPAVFGIK